MSLIGATSAGLMALQYLGGRAGDDKAEDLSTLEQALFTGGVTALGAAVGNDPNKKALEQYYKDQFSGISPAEAKQRMTQAAADVQSKQKEGTDTIAKRGGVSSAGGGTSGARMKYLLQQNALAAKAASEAAGVETKRVRDESAKRRALAAAALKEKGKEDLEQQGQAATLLLKTDIGAGGLDPRAKDVVGLTEGMTELEKIAAMQKEGQ